jgi:uncharacterized protein YciI
MLFVLVAHDQPNSVARRMELRPDHFKHLDTLNVVLAGPFVNDKGEGVGSIVVIEADDLAAARAAFARDPYVVNGLFDSITIKPWKLVVNKTATQP